MELLGTDGRTYPTNTIRVRTTCGDGVLVYGTADGFCGVQLDGETRVDEYAAEHVTTLAVAS